MEVGWVTVSYFIQNVSPSAIKTTDKADAGKDFLL